MPSGKTTQLALPVTQPTSHWDYTTAGLSRQTVSQVRQRYAEGGWQAALAEAPRSGGPQRFDGAQRAALTALACTPAPVGHGRWTLRLLADKAVELALVDSISHETVGQVLEKMNCSPTASSTGAWGAVNAAFVARMKDVLAIHARPDDPRFSVVCFDEWPCVLHG